MVWRVGVAPEDWRKALIICIPIYKKGSRLKCSNYRGIRLLSVVGKVYAGVMNDRVSRLKCSNYRGIRLLSVVGKVYAGVMNDRVKLIMAE